LVFSISFSWSSGTGYSTRVDKIATATSTETFNVDIVGVNMGTLRIDTVGLFGAGTVNVYLDYLEFDPTYFPDNKAFNL